MTVRIDAATYVAPTLPSDASEARLRGTEEAAKVDGPSFADTLQGVVESASAAHAQATQKAEAVAQGTLDDLHGTMISVKEAEISLKLVGSIRNKLLDAFHEIWRTNV